MNSFFEILNDFFDKTYVLTIPSATERQKGFAEDMKGLHYHFFYGTEKQSVTQLQLEESGIYNDILAKKNQRYGKSMTTAEIACAMGHRNIYKDMVANNVQKALIFEDDVFPLKENMKFLPEVLADLPANWDVLFFDYDKNEKRIPLKRSLYHVQHFLGFLKWGHTLIKNFFPKPVNKYWKTAGYHDFADAYAITSGAAKSLIQLQTPVSAVADNLLANAVTKENLTGYISVPKLFAQKSAGEFKTVETLVEKSVKLR